MHFDPETARLLIVVTHILARPAAFQLVEQDAAAGSHGGGTAAAERMLDFDDLWLECGTLGDRFGSSALEYRRVHNVDFCDAAAMAAAHLRMERDTCA